MVILTIVLWALALAAASGDDLEEPDPVDGNDLLLAQATPFDPSSPISEQLKAKMQVDEKLQRLFQQAMQERRKRRGIGIPLMVGAGIAGAAGIVGWAYFYDKEVQAANEFPADQEKVNSYELRADLSILSGLAVATGLGVPGVLLYTRPGKKEQAYRLYLLQTYRGARPVSGLRPGGHREDRCSGPCLALRIDFF